MKKLYFVPVIGFLVSLIFRFYQVFACMEADTGFFKFEHRFSLYILLALLLISIVATCILSRKIEQPEKDFEIKPNVPLGILSLITAMSVCVTTVINMTSSEEKTLLNIVIMIFGILAGIQFLVMAIGNLTGKNPEGNVSILYIMTPLWLSVKVVYLTFVKYTNVINISDNLLHILSLLSLIIFFFTYAKIVAEQKTEKTTKRLLSFGVIAIILHTVYLFSHIILSFQSGAYTDFNSFIPEIARLAILGVIVVILYSSFKYFGILPNPNGDYNEMDFTQNSEKADEIIKNIQQNTVAPVPNNEVKPIAKTVEPIKTDTNDKTVPDAIDEKQPEIVPEEVKPTPLITEAKPTEEKKTVDNFVDHSAPVKPQPKHDEPLDDILNDEPQVNNTSVDIPIISDDVLNSFDEEFITKGNNKPTPDNNIQQKTDNFNSFNSNKKVSLEDLSSDEIDALMKDIMSDEL